MPTGISWTTETWNCVVGCSHVSAGCDGCYAARDAFGRLSKNPVYAGLAHRRTPDELPRFTGEVRLVPERLDKPLRWKKPRRIFVNSMSDLFHEDVPDEYIAQVFGVMLIAHRHTFQVLTKRPQRMAALLGTRRFYDLATESANEDWNNVRTGHEDYDAGLGIYFGSDDGVGLPDPLNNVWLGTSVEDQRYANIRIPHLLDTHAAVRFLSVEPLLGPVDLTNVGYGFDAVAPDWIGSSAGGSGAPHPLVDWVIVGGESGPRSRRMDPAWCLSIVEQCETARVPVFVKQAGEVLAREWGCTHRAGAKIEEWPPEFRAQEYPA